MEENTADIWERARLRKEALLKRAQEEGIDALKYKTGYTVHDNVPPIKKISKIRRSNSFSDLSQKPVRERLLSWKALEKQHMENTSKMQPFENKSSNQYGSLTNLDVMTCPITISNVNSPKAQFSNEIQTASLKSESSTQRLNRMFPSYSACEASDSSENKENALSKKHYFEPKFGPMTLSKLNNNFQKDHFVTARDVDAKSIGIKKLGPATMVIQEKLSRLCQESWKKNQISENIKKKKEEDMQALTERWKDGMLCNEDNRDDNDISRGLHANQHVEIIKEIKMDQNGIPIPPPLPSPGGMTPKSWKSQTTPSKASEINEVKTPSNKSNPSSNSKNCGTIARDLKVSKELLTQTKNSLVSKNKIVPKSTDQSPSRSQTIKKLPASKDSKSNKSLKTSTASSDGSGPKSGVENFNRLPQPFSKTNLEKKFAPVEMKVFPVNESATSTDSFAENLLDDFEKNLKAMGYHVNKGQENKAMVELESATEDERAPYVQKMGRHDPILRSDQPSNRARVQSHIENPAKRNIVSMDNRPVSMLEHKKVVTNFSSHDIVTVTKKKCIKLDADVNGSPEVKKSRCNDNSKSVEKTAKQENDLKTNARTVKFTSKVGDESRVNVELIPNDDDDDDTYGLDDDHLDTSPANEESSSSDGSKSLPKTCKMETYFSITDVKEDRKEDGNDVYVEMSGDPRMNSSSDDLSEGCYPATEESDMYEEIVDSSPRLVHGTAKRHVSMRRAVESEYSDEENNDLMRRKIAGNSQRARPFTTTNASFDPPGHSSPIPYRVNEFRGSYKSIPSSRGHQCNNKQRMGYRPKSPRAALDVPTGTQARLIAASHHTRRDELRIKNHMEQFIDRRGHPYSQPMSCKRMEKYEAGSNPTVPAKPARVKIQSLEELIEQEEKFSIQASNALNICMKKSHLWTDEAVECHRILLTTSKRKEILLNELKRLKCGRNYTPEVGAPVAGKLIVNGLRLPLKPEFIAKLGTLYDTTVTYFIVTVQSGESIATSQTVSTKNPIILGGLEVPGQLVLTGVPRSFSAFVEVYALTVPRDLRNSSSKKVQAVKKATDNVSKRSSYKADSEDEQSGLRATYFIPVGRLELFEENINRGHFSLDGVSYPSPIQGTIHLKMKYAPERLVQYRGYLNVCIEGSREFLRKWCCLTQSEINLWRIASDEPVKEPTMRIDLMSCITDQLVPVAIDYHLQKDTFEIITIAQPVAISGRMKERMTERSSSPLNLQQTIYWFSADSTEECNTWCRLINRNLIELRTWHPYAIPPIKFRPPRVSPFIFDSLL